MSDVPAVNQVVGYLDRIDEAGLGGWVVDFADPAAMMRVRMLIDGVTADVVTCDLARDDEIARRLPHPRIGFYYQIPLRFHDGMRHVLSLATLGGGGDYGLQRRWGGDARIAFLSAPAGAGGGDDRWVDRWADPGLGAECR
jgi:hypothetical protein